MTRGWTSTVDDSDDLLNTTTTATFSTLLRTPPRATGRHQDVCACCSGARLKGSLPPGGWRVSGHVTDLTSVPDAGCDGKPLQRRQRRLRSDGVGEGGHMWKRGFPSWYSWKRVTTRCCGPASPEPRNPLPASNQEYLSGNPLMWK